MKKKDSSVLVTGTEKGKRKEKTIG